MIYFIRNKDLYIVLNMVTIYNYAFTMFGNCVVTLFMTVKSHSFNIYFKVEGNNVSHVISLDAVPFLIVRHLIKFYFYHF